MNHYKITFKTKAGTESECFYHAGSIEQALERLAYVYEGWKMVSYEVVK